MGTTTVDITTVVFRREQSRTWRKIAIPNVSGRWWSGAKFSAHVVDGLSLRTLRSGLIIEIPAIGLAISASSVAGDELARKAIPPMGRLFHAETNVE